MKRSIFMARYFASLEAAKKEPGKHSWYNIAAKKGDSAEIYVYDEIGYWGVTATDFIRDLKAIDAKTIKLRLNTPGGMVTDGHAMFNALKEHPACVTTYNDALAASMGSVLALVGAECNGGGGMVMAKNAMFMIHNPWGFAIGDDEEMMKQSELLSKMKGILADSYVEVTGKDKEEILSLMKAETWLTAQEAKDMGFCTEITGTNKEAKVNTSALAMFDNVPDFIAKAIADNEEVLAEVTEEVDPTEEVTPTSPVFLNLKRKQLQLLELN